MKMHKPQTVSKGKISSASLFVRFHQAAHGRNPLQHRDENNTYHAAADDLADADCKHIKQLIIECDFDKENPRMEFIIEVLE